MSDWQSWTLAFLLNALWQTPLLFAAAWLAARLARPAGPRWEHRLWVGALGLQLLVPAFSIDALRLQLSTTVATTYGSLLSTLLSFFGTSSPMRPTTHVRFGPGTALAGSWLHLPSPVTNAILLLYAVCVLYFTLRLLWGIAQCSADGERQLSSATPHRALLAAFEGACRRAGVPRARLALSTRVTTPQTIGILRPWLLLPQPFVEQATPADLEAALAHEIAHIQRHDFAKNLFYSLISLPLSFHPCMWMVRTRITASREMLCDALAADAGDGRESYARSLLRLAALAARQPARRNLHAIGIFDANIFERRVMQLTQISRNLPASRRLLIAAGCAALALSACLSAVALRLPVNETSAEKTPKKIMVSEKVLTRVTRVNPIYPEEAKKAKIQGPVVLSVIIGTTGEPEHISVKTGPPALQKSAIDAVRQWRWQPYLLNGNPVEVETEITITFELAG